MHWSVCGERLHPCVCVRFYPRESGFFFANEWVCQTVIQIYIYIVCTCVNVQEVTLLRRLRLCLLTGPDTRGSSSSLRKTEKERLKR